MLHSNTLSFFVGATVLSLVMTAAAQAAPPDVDPGGPYRGAAGEAVSFDASGTTDPDNDAMTFYWIFDPSFDPADGFSGLAMGPTADHTYDTAGSYIAKLFVVDEEGNLVAVDVPATVFAAEYIGDDQCGLCHPGKYADYIESGHPYKLTKTNGVEPAADTYPHTPPPPLPPDGLQWSNVSYIIGNFFWKARFVESDGYIHTGEDVQWNVPKPQWNFPDGEWVDYHAGEVKPYNCGRCHTTGYAPDGNQDDLPGLIGTWAQPGVRCEACHGPGSNHLASADKKNNPPTGGKTCSECHYRDSEFRMPWSGGFMKHHQQGEDFSHSPHRDLLDCTTCHDPHKSVVYDLGGTITECTDCHDKKVNIPEMAGLECTDCHMARMGKSARAYNDHKGDVRSHLFRIMTDPVAAADNTYEADGSTFWNQDENGDAFITLDYACLGCHADFDPDMTIEEAAEYAKGIHEMPEPEGDNWLVKLPLIGGEFDVSFEDFAGVILVTTAVGDAQPTFGVGMKMDSLIFWMDVTGTLYFGNINEEAGNMSGIVFGPGQAGSIFFGERQ